MKALPLTVLFALAAVVGCANELDVGAPGGAVDRGDDFAVEAGSGNSQPGDSDDGSAPVDNDGTDGEDDDVSGDDDVDLPPAGEPGVSPPPAESTQSCTVWQDCGPNFGDLNSGFDCDSGQCACNAVGHHDDDCAAIGGFWSEQECFCFVTSSRPPEPASSGSYDDRDDDTPYCWWRYREECDRDRWVDTSYYERVCTNGECRNVWRSDGHWEDGDCTDVWTKRCDDGSQYVYRY
ncbi:MAG TPA: hypothetical protein VGF99_16250 [Myxococcota bacterium]